ncbi:hypothetical protein SAMN04488057_101199 [Cyclobacterium lianum]|uniref:Uncharacterized protein n=1 Tax=Cyclobacterium lianum TaxID=388280 RepID=A0A1M7I6G0_9BACT|nr:hypothetical protein [Cyclobacterium lianum]SHM36017.1 hypothetical protein SAMN04488057_101199 [Cyclobacterium lianum]
MKSYPIILLLVGLLSCNLFVEESPPSEEQLSERTITAADLSETLVSSAGVRISRFIEDDRDKTAHFEAFVFNFDADGSVLANSGSQEINGTYRFLRDDGKLELSMTFPSNSKLVPIALSA